MATPPYLAALLVPMMLALASCGGGGSSAPTPVFDAARAKAQAENKRILLDFTGSDWCSYCVKLKGAVFETNTFREWADRNVVFVELDFPQQKTLPSALVAENEALANRYGVKGFPTVILTDARGTELMRTTGYGGESAATWTAKFDAHIKR